MLFRSILDLNKIKDEFFIKYPDLKNEDRLLNTIDLIDYSAKIKPSKKYENYFYFDENCHVPLGLKNHEEKSPVFVSSFPFGYSLSMDRLLYFVCKKLVYNIPPNFVFKKIRIIMPSSNFENELQVFDELDEPLDQLKSMFLDCYDFNFEKFEKDILSVDWDEEILTPKNDIQLLKEKIPGFILI